MAITESVVVQNDTLDDVFIPRLGYTVSASGGTQDLFADDNSPDEVFDPSVRELIEEDKLVFLFHTHVLSKEDSLLLFDYRFNRPQNITTVDPTINDDRTKGFLRGDIWVNKTPDPEKVFICKSYKTGAAIWWEVP